MKNSDNDWLHIEKGEDGIDLGYRFNYEGNYGKLDTISVGVICDSIRTGKFVGRIAGSNWSLSVTVNDYPLQVLLPEAREKLAKIVCNHCMEKSEYEKALKERLNNILTENHVNLEIDGWTDKGYSTKTRER